MVGTIRHEIDVFFQPIVETPTGRTVAVEALARWNSASLGAVKPDVFIPTAERNGLMHGLTLMLFEQALHYFSQMPDDLKLSFNLSAHDLTSPQTVLGLVESPGSHRRSKVGNVPLCLPVDVLHVLAEDEPRAAIIHRRPVAEHQCALPERTACRAQSSARRRRC